MTRSFVNQPSRLLATVVLAMFAIAACSTPGRGSSAAEACRIEDQGQSARDLPVVVTIDRDEATVALLAGPVGAAGEGVWILPCVVQPNSDGFLVVSSSLAKMRDQGNAVLVLDSMVEVEPGLLAMPLAALAGRVDLRVAAVEVDLPDGTKAATATSGGYFLAVWEGVPGVKEVRALDAAGTVISGVVEDHTQGQ